MLKFFLDRGTNKCCNKDITKYIHEYQIKRSSTSTKTSTSTSTKYDKYILLQFRRFRCSPHTLPYGSCTPLHSSPTPPPRCRNVAATPLQSAFTPPPRLVHAAPTSPPRRSHAAPTPGTQPPQRPTPAPSHLHAASTPPHATSTPSPRRPHAPPTPPPRRPDAVPRRPNTTWFYTGGSDGQPRDQVRASFFYFSF